MTTNLYTPKTKGFFKKIITAGLLLAFMLFGGLLNAQTVVTFNSNGSFTVPAGVTTINAYIFGAGGGGGGGVTGTNWGNGGGGGGGACTVNTIAVGTNTTYTISVGAGGIAGAAGNNAGGLGGTSTVAGNISGSFTASGGAGGAGSAGLGTNHAGGAGGSTGTGTIFAGGAGSAGKDVSGITGSGGGGAGSGAVGGAAPTTCTGAAGVGGTGTYPGGNGGYNTNCSVTTNLAGVAGTQPGGGGSGDNSWSANTAGGAGGAGRVVIVYTGTFTWIGNTSTAWNTASNWNSGIVPTAGDNVIIATGGTFQPTISVAAVCNNITLNSGTTLTINNTLAVGGTWTNNGATTVSGSSVVTLSGTNTIGGTSTTTFPSLTLAGATTLGINTTVTSTLNITTGSLNLSTFGLTMSGTTSIVATGSKTISGSAGSSVTVTGGVSTVSGSSTPVLTFGSNVTVKLSNGLNFGASISTMASGSVLQINSGGYVSTNPPAYAAGSLLQYNNGAGYGRGTEWSTTSSYGYPANVQVSTAGTVVDMGANAGTATARQCSGNLTIDASTTFSMNVTQMTAAVTVLGNLINNGTLALSASGTAGGDFKIGGNWTKGSGATFSPNGRAVFFIGTTTPQVITSSAGGSETFNFVLVQNTSTVQLNNVTATSITINSVSGLTLSSTAASNIDLNGQTLTISGGGNIGIGAVARKITSTIAGGSVVVSGSNLGIFASAGGTLTFGDNVSVALSIGMNFGAGLSTIGGGTSGVLLINAGGFVSTNSPSYATGSTLQYNTATNPYTRGLEWSASSGAGYPYNVLISNSTTVDPGGTTNTATPLNTAGSLTINSGSAMYMDYSSHNMTVPLTIAGSLNLNGSLSGSQALGGDIFIGGNYVNNGAADNLFTNSRLVKFNGGAAQTLSGTNTGTNGFNFTYLTIANTSGGVTLSHTANVANVLNMTSGKLTTSSGTPLTVTSTANGGITGGSATSFINGPVTWNLPNSSAVDYIFPVGAGATYLPFDINSPGGTSPVVTVQAFAADAGAGATYNSPLTAISHTEYWNATFTGTISAGNISIARPSALGANYVVAQSAAQAGPYNNLGGSTNSLLIAGNTVTSTTAAGSTLGYFVFGVKPPPTITETGSLSAFSSCSGTASTAQSFTISGVNMNTGITVTPPTGYEVSTTSGVAGFAGDGVAIVVGAAGNITTTTVWVRLSTVASGTPAGNVALTSTGATTVNVAVTGTVYNPITITSFSPSSACSGSGATITINGTNFATGTTVTVNGTTASPVTIVSPTQITVALPAGASGTGNIVVTNACGGVSSGSTFTVNPTPTISSFSPTSACSGSGTTITINGTNFVNGGTTATVNGTTATVTFVSSTQITVPLPAGASGTGNIVVTNTTGSCAATSGSTFTVNPTPTITSFSPASACSGSGTTITINGTNFVNGGTTATINGVAGTVTWVSSTQITVPLPATASGTGNIVVTNTTGSCQVTSGSTFTVNPSPTITSFSPASACSGSGTTITISGTNFVNGGTTATVNGTTATVTFVSSTQITVPLPAGASGTGNIVVTNTTGSCSATSGSTFTVNAAPASPTAVTASPTTICLGSSINLNATSTGIINWYDASSTLLGSSASGANFPYTPTTTVGSPFTYYAEAYSGSITSPTVAFTYTGSNQTWTVPAGVTSINVKVWGAGGGGSSGGPSAGGSGAFVKGTMAVTPGQSLAIVVGGGGIYTATTGGFGGGGASGVSSTGASGGGYSGIFNTSVSQANALAIAGAGGGGGYYAASTYGGAGGATTGTNAGTSTYETTTAIGGSTSAGGNGATGTGLISGGNGSALQGGAGGVSTDGGGGGGGGYYGGGGGYGSTGSLPYSGAGAGGASYTGSLTGVTNTVGTTSSVATTAPQAPGSGETGYLAGDGNGGSSTTTPGGNGLVIITYTTTTAGCPSTSRVATAPVTVNAVPTTSVAGPAQVICGGPTSVTLAANAAGGGETGTWSVQAGSPSTLTSQFSNVNSPTATFTPAGGNGAYILIWTISNGPCSSTSTTGVYLGTTTINWTGGAGDFDFNNKNNWTPALAPGSCTDVQIGVAPTLTTAGTVQINVTAATTTVNSLKVNYSNASTGTNVLFLSIGANTLTVNNATNVDVNSTGTGTYETILVLSSGNFVGLGAVNLGTATSCPSATAYLASMGGGSNTATGQFTLSSDLIIGAHGASNFPFGLVFDGTGTQNFTVNSTTYIFQPGKITIGNTNTPTVLVNGSAASTNAVTTTDEATGGWTGDLFIKAGATLDITNSTWHSLNYVLTTTNTSTFTNNGTLILEATAGGRAGSNFPNVFATNTLAATSTVQYKGAAAQTIYSTPIYGYLQLIPTAASVDILTAGANLNVVNTLTLNANATLNLRALSGTVGSLTGSGVIETNTAGTSVLTVGSDNTSTVYSGTIINVSGTKIVSLTKNGTGILSLSGTNTFGGGTILNAGTLQCSNVQSLGVATSIVTINGGTLDLATDATTNGYNVIVAGSATIQSDKATAASAGITHTLGTLSINASTLTITGGSNVTSGTATVAFGNTAFTGAPTFTVTNPAGGGTAQLTVGATTAAGFTATINGNGNAGQTGAWGSTGGGIIYSGTGILTLNQANGFTGGVTLNSGTLNINNATALGSVAGTFTINGGTINNTSGGAITNTSNNPIALNGDFTSTGTNILNLGTGATSLSADRIITTNGLGTLTLGGTIAAGTRSLTKAGAGTLAFGANAVTLNNLTISAGSLTSTSGTLSLAGNFSNSGTFTHNSGSVKMNGGVAQTITGVTTFNNLEIANTSGGVATASAETVAGILKLTSGILTTTSGLVTVTNNATGAVTNAGSFSATNHISGPLAWTLAAGTTYTFPTGKGGNYYPFGLTSITGTAPQIQVEAFNTDAGGSTDLTLDASTFPSTEYWKGSLNSGSYTSGVVSLGRATISPANAIGGSTTKTGVYTSLHGTVGASLITNSDVNSKVFFVLAKETNVYNITSSQSFTGANTYCITAAASPVTATFNNCTRGSGTATATNATITWYYNTTNSTVVAGATLVSGPTVVSTGTSATVSYSYTPSTGVVGNYYYFAVLTLPTNTGCGFTTSLTSGTTGTPGTQLVVVTPTVGTPTTPTPSATAICQGSGPTAYTTSASNATSYNWSVTGAGNSISGTGTTGTVTWAAGFSGTATISVTANGCNGPSASASTTVTVNPIPQVSDFNISAANSCSGGGSVVTVSSTTLATGNYTVTYNVSGTNTVSSTTATMSFTAGSPGTGTFTTAALATGGTANVVNVTAIAYTSTLSCTSSLSTSSAAFTSGFNQWTGATSTDWNTAGNWTCGSVPNSSSAIVLIPNVTNQPTIASGTYAVGNITIASGATLTNNGTLQIAGTLTQNGTFTSTGGTVEFNGTTGGQTIAASTFSGNTISGLTISNSGGVTLGGALTLTNVLSFGNVNTTTFASAGYLTLHSDATNTARIADVTNNGVNSGNTISGNVTVERWTHSGTAQGGRRAYRVLGPSVTTATTIHANWQEGANAWYNNPNPGYGTQITGSTVDQLNGFDQTNTGSAGLFTFNPASGWVAIANTNVNTLDAKTGYLLFIRGDRSYDLGQQGPSFYSLNATLRATGAVSTGTVSWSGLSSTANANVLVTNPYPSPIDWTKIYEDGTTANSTNYSSTIQLWDPSIGSRGGYISLIDFGSGSWTTSGGSSNITKEIQSGEAYFLTVKSGLSGTTTYTVKEQHKSTTNNLVVFTPLIAKPRIDALVYYTDPIQGRLEADGVSTIYDNSYCACVDGNDAQNFTNIDEDIAIMRNGQKLSIETRPLIVASDTMPLYMTHMKTQSYQWQFNVSGGFAAGMTGILVDNYTGTRTPVSLTDTTLISFNVDVSIAASKATNRFYVVFTPQDPLPVTITSIKAYQHNTGVNVDWTVSQQINMGSYEVEKSLDGRSFTHAGTVAATPTTGAAAYSWFDPTPNTGANYYRVKVIDRSSAISYTNIVRVDIASAPPAITVYPNPVKGNTFTLQLTNVDKGNYTMMLINKLGQVIYTREINHAGGSGSETITLDRKVAQGTYELKMGSFSAEIIKE